MQGILFVGFNWILSLMLAFLFIACSDASPAPAGADAEETTVTDGDENEDTTDAEISDDDSAENIDTTELVDIEEDRQDFEQIEEADVADFLEEQDTTEEDDAPPIEDGDEDEEDHDAFDSDDSDDATEDDLTDIDGFDSDTDTIEDTEQTEFDEDFLESDEADASEEDDAPEGYEIVEGESPFCSLPLELTCNNLIRSDTSREVLLNYYVDYACNEQTRYFASEIVFTFTTPCLGDITVGLEETSDTEGHQPLHHLFMLETCDPEGCVEMVGGNAFEKTLALGVVEAEQTFYFAVDSPLPEDEGRFSIVTDCDCYDCIDEDNDGHYKQTGLTCPIGDDCIDTNEDAYPGAFDIPCDAIDQDCSGYDNCDNLQCLTDETITTCSEQTLSASTFSAIDRIPNYSEACETFARMTGGEYVYEYTPECNTRIGATVHPVNQTSNLFLMLLDETCAANQCRGFAAAGETLETFGREGETLFFVVDGGGGHRDDFTIDFTCECLTCDDNDSDGFLGFNETLCPIGLDCNDDANTIFPNAEEIECNGIDEDCSGFDACCNDNDSDGYFGRTDTCPEGLDCDDEAESINPDALDATCNGVDENCSGYDNCPRCEADQALNCGMLEPLEATNETADDTLSNYNCSDVTMSGKDVIYSFTAATAMNVTLTLETPSSEDLDIFVLEEFCNAANCIAGDITLANPSTLHFAAKEGRSYFIVVDSAYIESPYSLNVACDPQ